MDEDIKGIRPPIPPTRPEPVVPPRPNIHLTPFSRESITPPERPTQPQPTVVDPPEPVPVFVPEPTPITPPEPPIAQPVAPLAPVPQMPVYEPPQPTYQPKPNIPTRQPLRKLRLPHLPKLSKKVLVIGGALCAILVVGGVYMLFFAPHKAKVLGSSSTTSKTPNGTIEDLRRGKPDYPTILPTGKTIDQLGGWARVSPADSDPVYAYADKISGILINVSEQPLPSEFDDDETDQHIADLATSYNADQKMTVGGITVFLGSSAKGPQSLIFTHNKLLVLIKSATKISNNSWAAYITSLK